ncbi:hypothetical protein [Candidatus Poriferisocius sp.]|uniref:hypothetical protein n=1 Tax=Candidatus Poriferisocius sp. TaxID=3101276 RepID=UPI003B01AF71
MSALSSLRRLWTGRASRRLIAWAVVWVVMAALLRVTLAAPEVCPAYFPGDGQASIDAGADWIVRTQEPSGRYLYEYDRRIESAKPGYNLVRHAGGTMSLYQLAIVQQGSNHQVVEAADRGMNYLLERAVDTSNGGMGPALSPRGPVKTGTAALTLVSLAHRRILTGDERYDGEMRALGRFLVGQQLPDGGMLNFWDPKTGAPVPGERSRFATGEASWGLALLHEIFPGEGWDAPVWAILDYLSTERDELEELWPPPWPDQWAAYTLGETAEWGLEDHHLAYAERLAGRFGQMIRWDAQREGVAKISHLPMPRGGGYGTILEGLGALEWLWLNEPRLADAPLRDRLECGAARLAEVQADDGAWYYDDQTRVDDQQHAISGLLMADVSFNLGGNKP